jgi:hypothetical protein
MKPNKYGSPCTECGEELALSWKGDTCGSCDRQLYQQRRQQRQPPPPQQQQPVRRSKRLRNKEAAAAAAAAVDSLEWPSKKART